MRHSTTILKIFYIFCLTILCSLSFSSYSELTLKALSPQHFFYNSTHLKPSRHIQEMVQAALEAGDVLKKNFTQLQALKITQKGPGDFVSQADTNSEAIIYRHLKASFPDYGFLMEEGGDVRGTDPVYRWVIDPLDGTTNFLHHIPFFCISIGLEENSIPIAGVIYDPIRNDLFWAEKGKGAFLNGKHLTTSQTASLDHSILAIEHPPYNSSHFEDYINILKYFIEKAATVRSYGSAALHLAYVAAGRLDGYLEYGLKPWDVAAGIIIVQEAGGFTAPLLPKDNMYKGESILAITPFLKNHYKQWVI
jgi:myo-inositol-1(or 4)-monophosphatase